MNIAILGFDTEGRSSYAYFLAHGHQLTILDTKTELAVPEGAQAVLGDTYLNGLDRFDLIVRTAGLPPGKIFDANPTLSPDKVTTQINEFFKASPTRNIIGVTGTKGKGTTSTLVARMLEAAGKDVHLAGNIGLPALDLLPKLTPDSWVVLELSSFQLSDAKYSPHTGVCLMVVPEHLNWHADFADYTHAKSNMFAQQTADDIAIYFSENPDSKDIAARGAGRKIPFYSAPGAYMSDDKVVIDGQTICNTSDVRLLGVHNLQNICAAVTAAWQVTQDTAAMQSAITGFSGLEHRLELVRELDGIRYYDDSFGTTPETAIVALQAFEAPKVIILGGADKGASYADLALAVKDSNVRKALLIGNQADVIQAALEAVGFTDFMPGGTTMPEIVHNAKAAAQPGDVVLLSTACASFGMFKDYKDRGNQFKDTIRNLA
ncbi:MAG: UDP-N-acetylmuramoylalanine--D-glutamate ligase [Candidatus Saccharibacteria bacterium]|nr:UDP-N-acetylmuramoylalanine--D-glutamate ligase [Candidatus Saccharibacteria bacterium]